MIFWLFKNTIHYQWLAIQEQPLVVYLEGPGLYGAGIPFLVSLLILLWVFRLSPGRVHQRMWFLTNEHGPILVGLLLACAVIGSYSSYWTAVGCHLLNVGLFFWPVWALIDRNFHPLLAYPLSYLALLFDDVFAAGQYGHWAGNFWFGVGGAGFHDGLFIGTLTACGLAIICAGLGTVARKNGLLITDEGVS
ncbi:hypothetical protein HF673_20095 [Acidithiobacillus thiooxidans]|jgi:hypothetical protein|uniref:hypothetical protein n=1 Tax=Acidithiobacillus thiooxidans TaxID=930 RepID=UPI001C06D9FD|nr:hypothetical protein [Acidithiobacillus thiooxidans]MBU2837961.1 hypothetical protein [Acidithiobacillus thiooxidans]